MQTMSTILPGHVRKCRIGLYNQSLEQLTTRFTLAVRVKSGKLAEEQAPTYLSCCNGSSKRSLFSDHMSVQHIGCPRGPLKLRQNCSTNGADNEHGNGIKSVGRGRSVT